MNSSNSSTIKYWRRTLSCWHILRTG